MDNQLKRKRGGFNVVDALILFLAAATLLVMIYVMFFFDRGLPSFLKKDDSSCDVMYTLEISPVDNIFLDENGKLPIEVGDSFYHVDKKYTLGSVVQIGTSEPYWESTGEIVSDGEGNNTLQYAVNPQKSVVTVTVKASAVFDGKAYLVENHALCVGDAFLFNTPYFTASARCISVEEVSNIA